MVRQADYLSLQALLDKLGKHTGYQALPRVLEPYLFIEKCKILSRHEAARMAFIDRHVDFKGKRVLDIGANSGYFSFEALDRECAQVTVYEGWQPHAQFIKKAAEIVGVSEKIEVYPQYYEFQRLESTWDICFLLNVLHHLGDDFGSASLSMKQARQEMIVALNRLSSHVETLILQLGFCWKGDVKHGLFDNGSKAELLAFLEKEASSAWSIEQVGIAEREGGCVRYEARSQRNISRDDSLGEFLNRPLIILKSRKN